MAVRHPLPRVRDLEEEVHGLPRGDEHRVLEDLVVDRRSVPAEHQEPLAVDVEGVLHGVEGRGVVPDADRDDVPDRKTPGNVHVLVAGRGFADDPANLLRGGHRVHHRHGVRPLDRREEDPVGAHALHDRRIEPGHLHREEQLVVRTPVEVAPEAGHVRHDRGVLPQLAVARRAGRVGVPVADPDGPQRGDPREVAPEGVLERAHAVLERVLPRRGVLDLHDVALGRRERHRVHPGLPLELREVGAHDLDPVGSRFAEREVEGAGVRDVGQEEPDDLAPVEFESVLGFPVHEEQVPETAHQRMGGPLRAPGEESAVVGDQQIVEHEDLLAVDGGVPRVGRRLDQHVSVEPEVLLDLLAVVRVVPVEAGVREEDPVLETAAGGHRVLGEVGHPVEGVVEAHAVPVDRGGPGGVVLEVDEDRGVLVHVDQRAGVLAVEAVHHVVASVDGPAHPARDQVERLSVLEAHDAGRDRVGQRFVRGYARQERERLRAQVAEARNHGCLREHRGMGPGRGIGRRPVSHRRVVHGAVVHRHRRALAGAADRNHQVVVGKDPGGRRRPAERQAAGAGLDVRRGLGAHQDHELVEGDGAELPEGSVSDLAEPHHRVHDGGGRPGDVGVEVAEGAGVGEALDLEVEPVALAPVTSHGNPEGARIPAQEGGAAGGGQVRRRVEGDAVEAGGAPAVAVRCFRLLGRSRARRPQKCCQSQGESSDSATLDAPAQCVLSPATSGEIQVVS